MTMTSTSTLSITITSQLVFDIHNQNEKNLILKIRTFNFLTFIWLSSVTKSFDVFSNIQEAKVQLEESAPQVSLLRRSSKEIQQVVGFDLPASEQIHSRLSGVKLRQRRLLAKVHKKQSDMERDMDVFKRFHENLKMIDDWLAEVDTSELDRPISIEPDVVREQIHKNEVSVRRGTGRLFVHSA